VDLNTDKDAHLAQQRCELSYSLALSKARPNSSCDYRVMLGLTAPAYALGVVGRCFWPQSTSDAANCAGQKMESRRQWQRGRFFWINFFGEAKKI